MTLNNGYLQLSGSFGLGFEFDEEAIAGFEGEKINVDAPTD